DIKIWDRELNPTEIARDYQILAVEESERSGVMIIIGIGIGAILLLFLSWRLWPGNRSARVHSSVLISEPATSRVVPMSDRTPTMAEMEFPYSEKLLCFGPLRIINSEGEDIAKRLSPKLKQL